MKEILMRLMIFALLVALTGLVMACGQANEAEEPTGDGIQVHGHWTVTVTDPDGTVARVHEFDNAFNDVTGSALLTALLAGGNSVATHSIYVRRTGQNEWHCAEGTVNQKVSTISAVATRDITVVGNPLMLTGGCTVTALSGTGHISKVSSAFKFTSPYVYCYLLTKCKNTAFSGAGLALTSHDETIPVANGQLVAFNIVFSFE